MLAAYRMVNVHDEGFVEFHEIEDRKKAFLPSRVGLVVFESLVGILDASPFHKIAHILEMIVKGLTVDPAVLDDVGNGDLVERLLGQEVLQGSGHRALCDIAHRLPLYPIGDLLGSIINRMNVLIQVEYPIHIKDLAAHHAHLDVVFGSAVDDVFLDVVEGLHIRA